MKPYSIFVVVQPGLEDIAQSELSQLGYRDITRIKGGFFLKGHLSTVIKLNLACRCITRVFIEIAQFEAHSFFALEAGFGSIPWRDYITDQTVCIRTHSYQSKLYHEKAIAERLIDTLSRALHKTITIAGGADEENTQLIVIYVKNNIVTVRMDSSGNHLHKRGYGTHKEDAPLRETIAAAMLYQVGWGDKFHKMHDPMCGSGTIAIEAALMYKQTLWSTFRSFSFQKWKAYQPDLLTNVQHQLCQHSTPDFPTHPVTVTASDINEKALVSTRINSHNASVNDIVEVKHMALDRITIDKATVVITNPPWGKRITGVAINTIWEELYALGRIAKAVYLILPEEQCGNFPYKFETHLVFKAGELKVRFVKLEV